MSDDVSDLEQYRFYQFLEGLLNSHSNVSFNKLRVNKKNIKLKQFLYIYLVIR